MNIKIKENRSQIVTGSIVCSTQQFAHMLSRSRVAICVLGICNPR